MASLNFSDSFISNSSIDETAWNFQSSGKWIKVKAMFTLYRIACGPPRKPYWIGLLFTHTKKTVVAAWFLWQREAVPRRSLKWSWVTCWIHVGVHTIPDSFSWRHEKLPHGIIWTQPKAHERFHICRILLNFQARWRGVRGVRSPFAGQWWRTKNTQSLFSIQSDTHRLSTQNVLKNSTCAVRYLGAKA